MGAAKPMDRVGMTPRRVVWVKRQSKRTMAISEYVKPILVSYLNSEAIEIPMYIAKWGHHWGYLCRLPCPSRNRVDVRCI